MSDNTAVALPKHEMQIEENEAEKIAQIYPGFCNNQKLSHNKRG